MFSKTIKRIAPPGPATKNSPDNHSGGTPIPHLKKIVALIVYGSQNGKGENNNKRLALVGTIRPIQTCLGNYTEWIREKNDRKKRKLMLALIKSRGYNFSEPSHLVLMLRNVSTSTMRALKNVNYGTLNECTLSQGLGLSLIGPLSQIHSLSRSTFQ